MSIAKSQEIAAEQLKELGKHVNTSLRNHWSSVEALAAALLNHNTLSKDEVYGIIEKDIPLEERANAERRLKGDYLDSETRKWIEELRVKHLSKAKNKISDNSSDKEA